MLRRVVDSLLRGYFRTREHPAKYRISRWLGKHIISQEGLIATVPPGIRLQLHPRDWIEYLLLRGDSYEPQTLKFMTLNLRPGDVAVLAGVNFGLHVAVAASSVGESGVVIGFEPQPAALLRAYANLVLNGLSDRVRLVEVALGSKEQIVPMPWSQPSNTGAASLLDKGPGLNVFVAPLSRLLPELCPAQPRLLLLDVQGYELSALAGMSRESAAELVIVESDPDFLDRAGITVTKLVNGIRELGYQTFKLNGDPLLEGESEFVERNIVGVLPGVVPKWVCDATAAD